MRKRKPKTRNNSASGNDNNSSPAKRHKQDSTARITTRRAAAAATQQLEDQLGDEAEVDDGGASLSLKPHGSALPAQPPNSSLHHGEHLSSPLSSPKKGAIRPRKVNIEKPLLTFRPHEISNIRAAQKHVMDHAHHCNLVGTLHLTQKDMELLQDCTPIVDKTLTNLQIPIPRYSIVDGSVAEPKRRIRKQIFKTLREIKKNPFRLPQSFISANSLNCMDIALEYDMKSDDENWLIEYNRNHAIPISEPNFERVYALAERCASVQGGHVSVSMIQLMNSQILETQSLLLRPILCEDQEKHLALLFPPDFSVTTILTSKALKDSDVHHILGYWKQKNEARFRKLFEQEKKVAKLDVDLQQLYRQRQICEQAKRTLQSAMKQDQDNKQLLLSIQKELQQCISEGVRPIESYNIDSFQTLVKYNSPSSSTTSTAATQVQLDDQSIRDISAEQQDHSLATVVKTIDPKQS